MTERPARADLDAYVAANAGRYTDDVLYQTLVAAGYPAADVRAALARASAGHRPQRTGPRAVRTILVAYVAVFALLSVGMLLNSRPAGYLMPSGAGGIPILAGALGFAFVVSLVWVGSRRLFAMLVLAVVGLYAVAALSGGGGGLVMGLVLAGLAVGGVVVILRAKPVDAGHEPALALLLVVPILLLLGVGGICVASGLPIPGSA